MLNNKSLQELISQSVNSPDKVPTYGEHQNLYRIVFELQKGYVAGEVDSVTAGDWIDVDNTDPANPIVNVDFTPIPTTIAVLQGGTLDDGIYQLTNGNNVGLVARVTDGEVESKGVITVGANTLTVDYDLANDLITVYYDGNGNIVSAAVIAFDFNASNYLQNNFLQDGGSDFTGATLGNCNYNNHFGDSKVLVNGGNANYIRNNLYTRSTVDLSLLTGGEDFVSNNISINGNTLTPNKTCDGLTINTLNSDYQNELTGVANVIDFNESPHLNWIGIVDANGVVDTISSLSLAPKNFRLKPEGTNIITIDPATTTNIFLKGGSGKITLDAANGDFMDFTHDGTNVYQVGYQVGEQVTFVIPVALSAAQIQTINSVPIDVGLPNAGAGYAWKVADLDANYTFVSAAFNNTTLLIRCTGSTGAQRQCINILNSGTSKILGSASLTNGMLENTGLELYAAADSVGVGDSTLIALITVSRQKLS